MSSASSFKWHPVQFISFGSEAVQCLILQKLEYASATEHRLIVTCNILNVIQWKTIYLYSLIVVMRHSL